MKSILISFLLFLSAQADEFELYLLAGQSNMDGRGKVVHLTKEQRKPSEKSLIYYGNPLKSSEGWKALGPGYSIAPKYKGGLPSPTFGPELGFVSALSKAQPGKRFALIKGSKGGTSLRADWKPGEKGKPETQGPLYRNFIETIKVARATLKKDGHSATLRGLIWHQGESDSKAKAEVHQERLAELIARLREDTGEAKLPIVLGQVFDNGKRDKVRTAIRKASEADPAGGMVSAEGLTTWDEGTHFDAKSQLLLGERFAEAMLKLEE
ncbi:sialate O-acetylesterase [Akkermansiaceae bacterium]|nr:sialate O-acetylesterase [Akkermansiaceae bacterium]